MTHVTLPASYVSEWVNYAYVLTANKARGMTVDHVLFAPSAASSQETAYTALSRGRYSNHIFAVMESGWEEALEVPKAQTFASDQHPTPDHSLAEAGRQPTAERGSDARLRLLAAHQASRAASPTAALSRDADREAARKQRQQHEQSGRQSHEAQRRERNRQGRRDDGPRIGM